MATKLKTYDCGDEGFYVEKADYLKLEQYNEALLELVYNNFSGLALEELAELNEKYKQL